MEQERILSNGEIEKIRVEDLIRKLQNIEMIDVKNYTIIENIFVSCPVYIERKSNMYVIKLIYFIILIIIYGICPSIQKERQHYASFYNTYSTNQNFEFNGETSKQVE